MATPPSPHFRTVAATGCMRFLALTLYLALALRSPGFGDAAAVVSTPALDKVLSKPETSGVPTQESLQVLAPADVDHRTQTLRERRGLKAKPPLTLTPLEREQRRVEIRQRLTHRMDALRQKQKSPGGLTPEEEKQLHRLEALSKGFQPTLRKDPADLGKDKAVEKSVPTLHKATPTAPQ